jgi:prepilin-type N-terminal cleavage/methylation domain-containing protein
MNERERARTARGFSLLELVVVVIAIAILTGVALDRLVPLVGRAERVSFMQVQSELQTALLLAAAEEIVHGDSERLTELAGANPMSLLLVPPANYLGGLKAPDHDELPGRSWYYDQRSSRLVYRPGTHSRFKALDGPRDRIELVVRFLFRDQNGDAKYQAGADLFDGLHLESAYRYDWPD